LINKVTPVLVRKSQNLLSKEIYNFVDFVLILIVLQYKIISSS